jgi:DNA-binding HxlR family transcriptional regulator
LEIDMTETNFQCGLEAVLAILGGKWKPLIVYHLASGPEFSISRNLPRTALFAALISRRCRHMSNTS